MKTTHKKHTRFIQPKNGKIVCSVIIDGNYIFSPTEAKRLGSTQVEEFTIKTIYYNDVKEFKEALKLMPGYECWDEDKKLITKTI